MTVATTGSVATKDGGALGSAERGHHPTCAPMKTARRLWPHQKSALEAIMEHFGTKGRHRDRCQLVMAPGTGKTLVSLRLAEKVASSGLVVVTVPTIALLGQTLAAYTADASRRHDYLAVCSDPMVEAKAEGGNKGLSGQERRDLERQIARDEAELATWARVVIAAEDIEAALVERRRDRTTVALVTHASVGRLAGVMGLMGITADLAVTDEAHRAAGVPGTAADEDDGTVHLGEVVTKLLPAKRRLFTTATPKIVRLRNSRGGEVKSETFSSMDDANLFGPEAFRYDFVQAVEAGILVRYRVVVLVARSEDVMRAIRSGLAVDVDDKLMSADQAAVYLGMAQTVHDQGIATLLSFHSTVARARRFAEAYKHVHQSA